MAGDVRPRVNAAASTGPVKVEKKIASAVTNASSTSISADADQRGVDAGASHAR